ncbi:MAG: HmuY family protein [Deltaproteobacteria bacterium]|nr:HmuY family protein [Deltaproteobacteria bacterium]
MMRNTPASRLRATPWWALLLAPALVFALVSCGGEASDPSGATDDETDGDSDDDDDDSNASDDAYSTDRQDLEANAALDLTDGDVFFNLREGRAVEVDDPTGDEDWDLWFTGWEIRTNGGISGVGLGGGVEFPEAGYDTIDTDAIPPVIFQDAHASVFDDWYDYDGTTHALASFGYVYLIKDGDRVHKAQIVSYYGDVGGARSRPCTRSATPN